MRNILFLAVFLIAYLSFAQVKEATKVIVDGEDILLVGSPSSTLPKTYTDITADNQTLAILDKDGQVFNIDDDYTTIIPDNFPVGRSIRLDADLFAADSTTFVRETSTTKFWIDLETIVSPTDEADGVKVERGRSIIMEKVDANTIKVFGAEMVAFYNDIFPDLAGAFSFPNSTNVNWTNVTTATPSLVAGTPNEVRITSVNNAGSDFATQNLVTTPVSGDTYICTGELFYESGAFGHAQLRQVGGVNNKFECNTSNTTTWQPFSFILTLSGTATLVFDAPTDGAMKLRNIRVSKQ